LPGKPLEEMTKELREETGLDLDQIERVVMLANAFLPEGPKESEPSFDFESDSDAFGTTEESDPSGGEESSDPGSDPEGAPEGEDGTDPGNGASRQRSGITTGTFPVALQEDDGSGVAGSINANEAELFPEMKPFFCIVVDVVDGVDLTATAEKITAGKATAKAGDHTYYPYSKDDDGPSACVLSKTTILLAEEPHMKKILATGNSESPLSKELANLESTNDISFVALVGDAIRDMGAEDSLEQLSKTPNPFIPAEITKNAALAKDIQAVSVAINLSGETFLQVNVATTSSDVAGKLTAQLEDTKKKGQESLAAMPSEGNPIAELGNALVNGLSINNNQGRVSVALKMSQEDLQKAVDMAMSFATMFGPGPGDFGPETEFSPDAGPEVGDFPEPVESINGRKLRESPNRP